MTDEELVKKAEEYIKTNNIEWKIVNLQFSSVKEIKKAYIASAKETGVVWHDLRKNPNDLPKKVGNYLVCYLDTMLERHTFELSYVDYLVKEHWIDEYNHNIETYDEGVIAWCEIPKFEDMERT